MTTLKGAVFGLSLTPCRGVIVLASELGRYDIRQFWSNRTGLSLQGGFYNRMNQVSLIEPNGESLVQPYEQNGAGVPGDVLRVVNLVRPDLPVWVAACLLHKQWQGEQGPLKVNGSHNFLFLGRGFTLQMTRHRQEWNVGIVAGEGRIFPDGSRVFANHSHVTTG